MPSLEAYSRDLPYSYALGLFPASELMRKRPELARRLLVASRAEDSEGCHLALHHPSDKGNLGTMLRTALGFGYRDIAIIRPAADAFDPHVVRASMGAIFGLNVRYYDDFAAYRADFPQHMLYPFMLDASVPLDQAVAQKKTPFTLIMGNEGSGLPAEFAAMGQPVRIPHNHEIDSLNLSVAAAIGMYTFANH